MLYKIARTRSPIGLIVERKQTLLSRASLHIEIHPCYLLSLLNLFIIALLATSNKFSSEQASKLARQT